VTPLDDKLNAVLAEARRAAAGRISGSFKREEPAPPDAGKADSRRIDALEKALEAEKAARDVAAVRDGETFDALRAAASGATSRIEDAHAAIAALKADLAEARTAREAAEASARDAAQAASDALSSRIAELKAETEDVRRGLADAIAAERAARESAEAAALETSSGLAAQIAALTEQLQAAKAAAEASHASAAAASDRARRLEEALRGALRDLSSGE
jgi:chromosome segregation ATPase